MSTATSTQRPPDRADRSVGEGSSEPTAPVAGPARDRGGAVSVWALLGVIVTAIAVQAWVRWIASPTQFAAAPIVPGSHFPEGQLIALRVVEVASAFVFFGFLWLTVASPWRRERRLGLDAKLFVGCLIASITDGVLNLFHYLFAWNAHSINLGSWAAFLPFHSAASPSRYAEALVWGVPMYIYFVLGVGMGGCAIVGRLRRRYPDISNAAALGVVFVAACVFDLVVENVIIRATDAYAFTQTIKSVTLWPGTLHQFPLYEMVCVALLGVAFTALRLSAADDPAGVSFAERGIHRHRQSVRGAVRWLAVIGFCVTTLLCVYHIPFNWLGSNGDSVAPLPTYMQPGIAPGAKETFPGRNTVAATVRRQP
jgi:Spirocyclase AveC-like